MTEEEYALWSAEGDQRVGRCPFCGKPGWIVGDPEWCEHYAGTDSWYDGFLGDNSITDFEAYDRLSDWLAALQGLSAEEQRGILTGLNVESHRLVQATIDLYGPNVSLAQSEPESLAG